MTDINALNEQLIHGDLISRADAAEKIARRNEALPPQWTCTIYDKLWRSQGEAGDFMEASGSSPRNSLPSATLKLKGDDPFISTMMNCRKTMVGVTMETQGLRFAYYVDTHDYEFKDGAWTGTAHLLGIWDILNYYQIWPDNWLPIQAQIFPFAIFIGPICTVIENMIAETSLRLQIGLWEFVNNALSLNPDIRAWFGTLLQSNGNLLEMLKTPVYVVRTNPFFDTSPLVARTVRMESCATVIKDLTRAYGVDVHVDLWLPGDEQPDEWTKTIPFMALDQPTYVVTVKDRSQIVGPTGTILDSIIKTVVDLEGSLLGDVMDPILNPNNEYVPEGMFIAPLLGVHFVKPWVLLVAPDMGKKGSINTCKISDHTPRGWQHIIGGRSPKWLNDLMNALFAWIIDAISILIGFIGIPSNLIEGFMNNALFAFQLIEHYSRRNEVGPYHPCIEVFHATNSAPYNIETLFAFINAFWDSRGYTSVQATFRNGDVYTLGKDVFPGQLVSIAYMNRTKLYTDYIEMLAWRIDETTRDIWVQVGDGKAKKSPLAKHQRFITGVLESINSITLAPQSQGLL